MDLPPNLTEYFFDIACNKFPVIQKTILNNGDNCLEEYTRNLKPVKSSYQNKADFFDRVYQHLYPLFGKETATKAVKGLESNPIVLTTNHHGVDYCVSSVNGNLIFSLPALSTEVISSIPILSFGNIPLNNITYPRGILLYQENSNDWGAIPQKIPVFPDRLKKSMVSTTPPFDIKMIQSAESRIHQMITKKQLNPNVGEIIYQILREDYCQDEILIQPSYANQSVLLNNRIWKRMFSPSVHVPELIYIEIEKITATLLENDLSNPDSLAWNILFDSEIREHVLNHLDRVDGCWHIHNLYGRISRDKPRFFNQPSGTIFFWGIDPVGRRIPFYLKSDSVPLLLVGTDDTGKFWEIEYSPQSIVYHLRNKFLLPSVFTCFLVNAFARGLSCVGGYFQYEYLPKMQTAVVSALSHTGYPSIADQIAKIPTQYYLCGMIGVMRGINQRFLLPAGPIEIIENGGLTFQHIDQLLSITIKDAHVAGLFDTIPDAVPNCRSKKFITPTHWKQLLAEESFRLLKNNIVIL